MISYLLSNDKSNHETSHLCGHENRILVDHLSFEPTSSVKDTCDFATIYHGFSTDTRPRHNPKHVGSWCFYHDAKARGMDPKKVLKTKHKELLKTLLDYNLLAPKIKPLYRRLADPVILTRCLSQATQNANKNLHGKIW